MKKKAANNRTVNGWQSGRFDSRIQLQYGASLPESKRVSGHVPVFGSNGRVGLHTESLVKGPGIIVGRKGTIGAITWSDEDFWPIDTTYYVESDPSLDLRWLFYKLQTLALDKMNTASGTPGLNREEVYRLQIEIPPLPEQEKVAEILGSVDEEIQKTDEIIATTEKLKRGLLQKFFKKKKGWHIGRFDNLMVLQRGFDLPTHKRERGVFPLVSSNGITDTHKEAKVKGPGVITGRSGTIGKVFYVERDFWPLNTTLYVKEFYNNDPMFVYYFLQNFKLERFYSGTGVPTLNRNDVHSKIVAFPSDKSSQRKIASILQSVDEKILVNKKLKVKLDFLKKGLMKDLLSGKVRTI
ncbi:MAG: restriction endonuclease subunit S [Candidatus Moraniibacteriota bacterium]|nr:MAG: restriction endonuclease subunit S [Candidatus Moranbacteria bacterium]